MSDPPRPSRRLGLLPYFFVSFTLLAVVPLLGLGWFQADRWESVEVERAERTTTFAAKALARQVGQVMEGYARSLALVAGQLGLGGALSVPRLRPALEDLRARFGDLADVSVLAPDGACLVLEPAQDAADRPLRCSPQGATPFFRRLVADRRLALSDVEVLPTLRKPGIRLATPILDGDGRGLGYLVGEVPSTVFQAFSTQLLAEYPGFEAMLLDPRGTIAARNDEAEGAAPRSVAGVPLYDATLTSGAALRRGANEAGAMVMAAVAPIRTLGLGWTAVVSQLHEKVELRARQARNDALTAAAMALLFGLALAAVAAAWLARPIARLARWASDVGHRLSTPVPPMRPWHPREVAALAAAAQTMVAQLREHTQAVEGIVRERTDELRRTNETLRGEIEERTRVTEALRQVQKMEAMGRLAGGVAHDFNNLLVSIMGFSGLLLEQLPEDHPMRGDLAEIHRAGEQAAALTRQLLAFSRKQVLDLQVLDVNAIVDGMGKMLRRLIDERIELKTSFEPSLGRIRADRSQVEQVLLNLVVNARDAMPSGGVVLVSTANALRAEPETDASPRRYVCLSVEDSGHGMDEETRRRIFEPFFTTKPAGQGTGLGLATVYGIVRQSGGFVDVASEPGRGARFDVYLPRADDHHAPSLTSFDASPPPGGTETLLVVEDAPSVRGFVAGVLRGLGYHVHEAPSGEAALRLLDGYRGGLDLLVTDVVMPGMNGRELGAALRVRFAGARILYMSGYAEVSVEAEAAAAGAAFLPKPFDARRLAHRVRAVLDGPPPQA